jgi:secreted trypsin-like serine protease
VSANKVIRAPLWATLLAALVTAMVVAFFVFVQSGEAAPQAADEQPSAKTPKIIGGTQVPNGKYPFVALLNFHKKGIYVGHCGGSLIDQDSVLTAAHCLFGDYPKGTQLQVIVGRTERTTNQGQVRSVKSASVHPNYNPKKPFTNDAAVVNLSRPVTGITPIELATSKQNYLERPGRNATAAGWGNTLANPPDEPGGPHYPLRMHEVQLPIVSDSRAEQVHRRQYIPPLMIAAGGKGKDTCQGDSGGPLFVALGRNGGGDGDGGDDDGGDDDGGNDDRGKGGSGGKYTQIGITSFGAGCGAFKGSPGVYTEVNNPSIRSYITNAASK